VCQIGKIKGAKVVAIAGGPDKCKWLKETLGVDEAIDYKAADFHDQCKKKIGYLDVFFDNVGGECVIFLSHKCFFF
jgi:NADPH-dependent curcumin reductase CurA